MYGGVAQVSSWACRIVARMVASGHAVARGVIGAHRRDCPTARRKMGSTTGMLERLSRTMTRWFAFVRQSLASLGGCSCSSLTLWVGMAPATSPDPSWRNVRTSSSIFDDLQGKLSYGPRGAGTIKGKETVVVTGCARKLSSAHDGDCCRASATD